VSPAPSGGGGRGAHLAAVVKSLVTVADDEGCTTARHGGASREARDPRKSMEKLFRRLPSASA